MNFMNEKPNQRQKTITHTPTKAKQVQFENNPQTERKSYGKMMPHYGLKHYDNKENEDVIRRRVS